MKETLMYFKQQLIEAKDVAILQWRSFTVACILLVTLYMASVYVPPGWISWACTLPAAFVVSLTSLARVNDIGPERMGRRWEFRKVGLVMTGAGAVMLMATPFTDTPSFPTWRVVIIMWGVALTWLTTPGQPPWDYYITGRYRFLTHPPGKPTSPLHRFINRYTPPMTPEELEAAQKLYEEAQKSLKEKVTGRRGDGNGP